MRNARSYFVGMFLVLSASQSGFAATTADILFVVDESGSMAGEHSWIRNMVTSLDSELVNAGVTGNRYGLVGFGAGRSAPHAVEGHGHTVGSGQWGTAADLSAAAGSLVTNGATEDGYDGMNYGFANYQFRSDAAVNVILITDEDRDNINSAITTDSIKSQFTSRRGLLNAVVDADFENGSTTALGINADPKSFFANGSGGYTVAEGGAATGGSGNTVNDYVTLALATGGAAWDLNQLRAGGAVAQSFTDAFVDIKVGEIQQQPIPIPAALPLFSTGLAFLAAAGRRKQPVADA